MNAAVGIKWIWLLECVKLSVSYSNYEVKYVASLILGLSLGPFA